MLFILIATVKGLFAKAGMLVVTILAACATLLLSAALLTYKRIITFKPRQFIYACIYTAIIVTVLFLSCEIRNAVKYSKKRFSKSYNAVKLDLRIKELQDESQERREKIDAELRKRHKEREKVRKENKKNVENCIRKLPNKELFKKGNQAAKKCLCEVLDQCD